MSTTGSLPSARRRSLRSRSRRARSSWERLEHRVAVIAVVVAPGELVEVPLEPPVGRLAAGALDRRLDVAEEPPDRVGVRVALDVDPGRVVDPSMGKLPVQAVVRRPLVREDDRLGSHDRRSLRERLQHQVVMLGRLDLAQNLGDLPGGVDDERRALVAEEAAPEQSCARSTRRERAPVVRTNLTAPAPAAGRPTGTPLQAASRARAAFPPRRDGRRTGPRAGGRRSRGRAAGRYRVGRRR